MFYHDKGKHIKQMKIKSQKTIKQESSHDLAFVCDCVNFDLFSNVFFSEWKTYKELLDSLLLMLLQYLKWKKRKKNKNLINSPLGCVCQSDLITRDFKCPVICEQKKVGGSN